MHTTTNYLLVKLAFTDAITISISPLFFFSSSSGHLSNGFGKFACTFLALNEIAIVVSAYALTVLAIERHHALLKPFKTGLRLNKENIKKEIALIWVSSVLGNLLLFFFQEWSESHSRCTGPWSLHMNLALKVYVIINAAV